MVPFESDPTQCRSVVSDLVRCAGPPRKLDRLTETAAGHCVRIDCTRSPRKSDQLPTNEENDARPVGMRAGTYL